MKKNRRLTLSRETLLDLAGACRAAGGTFTGREYCEETMCLSCWGTCDPSCDGTCAGTCETCCC